ncbi:MAG: 30S ribosomal protein S2, partial [Candidatus Paceibacteria bacterium]
MQEQQIKVTPEDFTALSPEDEEIIKQMLEAGLHWGRRRSLTHPKMRPYIFSSRGELEIIDLAKTLEALKEAKKFIKEVIASNGIFLLLGTQPAARNDLKNTAQALNFPYVVDKWLGGTITNFKTIYSRIHHLKDLEQKINSPEFAKYTKKERHDFQMEYNELKKKFEGLLSLSELPAAIFVFGVSRHKTAIREAR